MNRAVSDANYFTIECLSTGEKFWHFEPDGDKIKALFFSSTIFDLGNNVPMFKSYSAAKDYFDIIKKFTIQEFDGEVQRGKVIDIGIVMYEYFGNKRIGVLDTLQIQEDND